MVDIYSLACTLSLENIAEVVEDCDSFEDSSSLSSGLSENIDEISTDDLTGSSLSDHQAAYHNFGVYPSARVQQNGARSGGRLAPPQPPTRGVPLAQGVQSGKRQGASGQQGVQRRSEIAQQTENKLIAPRDRDHLQQRKMSEQENIDQLLQKCRTSTRGLGAGCRPKSENMNALTPGIFTPVSQVGKIQMSDDGQTLSVCAQQQNPNYGARTKTPLTGNTLKILRDQQNGHHYAGVDSNGVHVPRPGSAQGSHRGANSLAPGYHSLDRKRLMGGYYSENDTYGTVPGKLNGLSGLSEPSAAALAALVSPRRYPMPQNGSLSLPVSHEGPLPLEEWTDEGMNNNNGTRNSRSQLNSNSVVFRKQQQQMMMSRSLIERKELKISPQDPSPADHPATVAAYAKQNGRVNGHANGPVPGPRLPSRPPGATKTARSHSQSHSNSENVYANLIQRAASVGPDGSVSMEHREMYLHSLTGDSETSPGGRHSLASGQSPYLQAILSKGGAVPSIGEEEVHGSSLSLNSQSSSIYSTVHQEERYQAEIRKLHREVEAYRDKVKNLTAQQNTYSSMVQAFEKALQGMVKRVETLHHTSQQKDEEVTDLRYKIDLLRELSVQAGINVDNVMRCSSPAIQRRHTFNDPAHPAQQQPPPPPQNLLQRQPSSESMTSTKSGVSSISRGSRSDKSVGGNFNSGAGGKAKKGWGPSVDFQIRSSFSRAFKKKQKGAESMSDVEEQTAENGHSVPASPFHSARGDKKSSASLGAASEPQPEVLVQALQEKLADKDSQMMDIRLEALTTAHEVDQLKEALNRLRNENSCLKQNNEKLSRIVSDTSRHGSQTSLPMLSDGESDSVSEFGQTRSDVCVPTASFSDVQRDMRKLLVSVRLDLSGECDMQSPDHITDLDQSRDLSSLVLIGQLAIGARTSWDRLDTELGKLFNEYLHKVDPVGNLNLNNIESLVGYRLGSGYREKTENAPADLPSKCIASTSKDTIHTLQLVLKGVKQQAMDALAFDTLVPKSNLQRFVHQLHEQKRLILCGSCGTGKSHLAEKLADYLVLEQGKTRQAVDRVVLSCGDKSGQTERLKRHLAHVVKLWKENSAEAPSVVILDNLHEISAFSDVFSVMSFFCAPGNANKTHNSTVDAPYVIGTMNQSTPITSLQIQHNFRFVLWANHMDPVRGFLGRYLKKRQIEEECRRGVKLCPEMIRVLEWLPKVWMHLNKFLEAANSPDVTIGPRLFLDCPLGLEESRTWFVDLWNGNVHRYLVEAAREGLQMFGRGRSSLEDPTDLVCDEWPWTDGDVPDAILARISPQELSAAVSEESKVDPLVMLMRLRQEVGGQKQDF